MDIQTAYTIHVNKAAKAWDIDLAKLSPHVVNHIVAYGVRQILNDAAASAKNEDEAINLVQKRVDNLVAGTLRASVGRTSDPVAREAKALGIEAVTKAFAKKGVKRADAMKHKDFNSLVTEYAARASTLETAKAIVATRKDSDDEVEIDL